MNTRVTTLVTILFLLAVSLWFALLRFELNLEHEPASLDRVVAGTADRPFQYRALIPWGLRLGHRLFPEIPLKIKAFYVEVVATLLLFLTFGNLARQLVPWRRGLALIEFLLLLGLVCTFVLPRVVPMYYVSDIPSLLFISLGLWTMIRERDLPLLVIFTLGCLNRETILLLTFVFCFWKGRRLAEPRNRNCLLAQIVIWVAVKGLLTWLYFANPGPAVSEWHLYDNLLILIQPGSWPILAGTFGFVWLALLASFDALPNSFERSALLGCLPFTVILLVVGNVLEVRIFGDMLPILLLALFRLWQSEIEICRVFERSSESSPPPHG